MGRRKGYDPQTLAETALGVFHRRGFRGASTAVLVRELGVNRNSVYSEFGSKEGLFAAALGCYDAQVLARLFGPLEATTATLDHIEALYLAFSESADDSKGLGCLMCNTAAELGGSEPRLQPLVERYFERIALAFGNALAGAARAGQVAADIDVAAESRFLASSCLGIFVMVRARIETTAAQAAIAGALGHLRLLRRTARKAVRH